MFKNGNIMSGLLIGLAGWIFCSVGGGLLGSILFSLGLLSVVYFGSFLYTGKAGSYKFRPLRLFSDIGGLGMILVGNIIGCLIIALIAKESGTINEETISGIISSRERNDAFQTLFRSIGCGFLMELAVWSWRSKGSVFGVLLCVPACILSGFYHSVADAFYYLVSYDKLGIWVLWVYPITVFGNFIGCSIRRVFYGNSEESNK